RWICLRLLVGATAEQPLDEPPCAMHGLANVMDEALAFAGGALAFLPEGAGVATEVLPFVEEVLQRALLVMEVGGLLSVHLLDLLRVMSLRGFEALMEDLVPLVQELLAGLRHVKRLMQLLVALPGSFADLVH